MAKRNLGIVSKILSNIPATTPEEPKSEKAMKKDTLEEKFLPNHGKRSEASLSMTFSLQTRRP
jgi:hypothetical protein